MDVDTAQTFGFGPAFDTPVARNADSTSTVAWPMRRGAVDYGGTVSWNGSPAERRVFLLDLQSLSVLADTASAADGTWSLPGWSGSYSHIAMSVDSSGMYQAIAYDRV